MAMAAGAAAAADQQQVEVVVEINSASLTLEGLQSCLGLEEAVCQRLLDCRPYKARSEVLAVLGDAGAGIEGFSASALLEERVAVEPSDVCTSGVLVQCWENVRLRLPGSGENVKRAWFGAPGHRWQHQRGEGMLCTEEVVERLRADGGVVTAACGCLGADPVPGVRKQLCLELLEEEHVEAEPGFPMCFGAACDVPSAPRWVAFIRHAEAGHNADHSLSDTPDTTLTPKGVAQALRARDGEAGAAVRAAELVVTSPLRRAMQTTGLLSEGSSVRIAVGAGGTERWSARCDEGSPKSALLGKLRDTQALEGLPEDFPEWEGWDTLSECWWPESGEDQWARREAFVRSVQAMPEDRLVFVGHGGFWSNVTGRYLQNCEVVYCDRSLVA